MAPPAHWDYVKIAGKPSRPSETGFADLVARHSTALWRYLRMLGAEPALAEDLVQEVFVAVWKRPFEDRGAKAAAAYLRRAGRNLFLMRRRRDRSRPSVVELQESEDVWLRLWDEDDGAGYRQALDNCLEELPERPRQAVHLFYGAERSRDDVGRAIGMTANGVKALLQRTRGFLRDCIERRLS